MIDWDDRNWDGGITPRQAPPWGWAIPEFHRINFHYPEAGLVITRRNGPWAMFLSWMWLCPVRWPDDKRSPNWRNARGFAVDLEVYRIGGLASPFTHKERTFRTEDQARGAFRFFAYTLSLLSLKNLTLLAKQQSGKLT